MISCAYHVQPNSRLTCQIKVTSNGTPNAFGVRFTDVYARRDGRWQMVTWQSTKLPA